MTRWLPLLRNWIVWVKKLAPPDSIIACHSKKSFRTPTAAPSTETHHSTLLTRYIWSYPPLSSVKICRRKTSSSPAGLTRWIKSLRIFIEWRPGYSDKRRTRFRWNGPNALKILIAFSTSRTTAASLKSFSKTCISSTAAPLKTFWRQTRFFRSKPNIQRSFQKYTTTWQLIKPNRKRRYSKVASF